MGIYEEKIAELNKLYADFENFSDYELNREKFNEFYKSGNRLIYEDEYFARRGCVISRAMYSIINKNRDTKLVGIINAICDEFTWALPAHISTEEKNPEKVIDLFSAETAQTLSEIAHYIELPRELHEKIRRLIFERVIKPYEENEFWWEKSNHNWAAVCDGCVGMTYLYEFPERFDAVSHRLIETMNCFLSGYGDDGACLEGLGYWNYGFGYFIYFAELLRKEKNIDLLNNEKVKKIAEFQQNMFLKNGVSVSFSDGFREGSFNIGLTQFLKREFSGDIKIPNINYRRDYDECYRWAGFFRSFLWLDDLKNDDEFDFGEKYFSDAQWYINKQKYFSFAAKGGNNAEPHNHNDVGNFIIADDERQLIMDFGAGEYTRDYFNDDERYKYFCTSSMGHNVPIVDDNYQRNGEKYHANIIKAEGNEFVLDIGGAYDVEGLVIERKFEIRDSKISLHDEYKNIKNEHKIIERFVSSIEPIIKNRDTKIGSMIVKSSVTPQIEKCIIKNHSGGDEAVYTLDYEVSGGNFKCEFIFLKAL
jgi:hypothetical protein